MAAEDTVVMPDSLVGSDAGGDAGGDSDDQTQETGVGKADGEGSKTDAGDGGNANDNADGETQPDPDDKTAKRVADTDKALKDKQRELHDLTMQIAARKAVQAEIDRQRDSGGDGKGGKAENPFAFLDSDDHDAEIDATPGKMVRQILKDYTSKMVAVFESRDAALTRKFQEGVEEATSPERAELRETLAELRGKEWFAKLPKDAQITAAKEWREATSGKPSTTVKPHESSPGGTGRRTPTPTKTAKELRDEAAAAQAEAVFGKDRDPDEELYIFGKPKTEGKK